MKEILFPSDLPARSDAQKGEKMEAPISVKGLRKAYQGVPAVRDISFSVNPGEIFGLLGENGAGKSTTIIAYAEAGSWGVLFFLYLIRILWRQKTGIPPQKAFSKSGGTVSGALLSGSDTGKRIM